MGKYFNQQACSAKKRLESVSKFLFDANPAVFEWVDKVFNIVRFVDLKNLRPLLSGLGGKVLEIGCGKGYFAEYFIKNNFDYFGLDIEKGELDFAGARGILRGLPENKKHIVQGDATRLPFKSSFFDVIFCNCVIEHIPDDQALLEEAARVLKDGGAAIFTFPTSAFEPLYFKKLMLRNKHLRFLADPAFKRYFSFASIDESEEWYVKQRWDHARRGYTLSGIKERFGRLGMEIKEEFCFFTQPLSEVWDICTFSRLNCMFPFSLSMFSPIMRMMNVTKRGTEKNSQLFAVKAIIRKT